MAFFAAAEGVAAPEDLFDDPAVTPPGSRHAWTCVARVDPDTVVLGSQRALFCVMDMRPGQGYSVRHSWRSRPGKELVEMEFCAQMNACWALERDGHGHGHGQALELVRYDLSHDGEEPGRAAVPVSADEATHVVSPNGTVALSLPGGVVELWRGGQASSRLQQVGTLHLSPVLGINTHYQLFKHLVLVGPLLVVGVSTDVWVVQLGGFAQEPQPTGADGTDGEDEEDEEGPAVAGGTPAEAGSLVGQVENRADMLDCAVPQRHECALARPPKALVSSSSSSVDLPGCNGVDLSAAAMVVARLSFHRPRYFVSKVRLVAVGPTWVELLVVSGQAACLYRVTNVQEGTATDMAGVAPRRPSAGNARATAPVLVPLVELGFNTKVLATAKGPAAEYPWLYVLTLSGIEVWCVPPPGSPPGERSPCRLLVQRLEYRQRLDRLPPLAMLATRNALVLLANPPGHIPSSLPDMLFHTVPRPSLAHIPELSSSGPSAGAGSKRSVDGVRAPSCSRAVLVLLSVRPFTLHCSTPHLTFYHSLFSPLPFPQTHMDRRLALATTSSHCKASRWPPSTNACAKR